MWIVKVKVLKWKLPNIFSHTSLSPADLGLGEDNDDDNGDGYGDGDYDDDDVMMIMMTTPLGAVQNILSVSLCMICF